MMAPYIAGSKCRPLKITNQGPEDPRHKRVRGEGRGAGLSRERERERNHRNTVQGFKYLGAEQGRVIVLWKIALNKFETIAS